MTLNLNASKSNASVNVNVNQTQKVGNPYDAIEKEQHTTIQVEYPKDSKAALCDSFAENDVMIAFCNYLIDKYAKGEKEIVTVDMLMDIVKELTNAESVFIDLEDVEIGCCGGTYKSDNYKKIAAIFVTKKGVRYNLKYNLTQDFLRLSRLKISLKTVRV